MNGQAPGSNGKPGSYRQEKVGLELFDLKQDIGETVDVSADYPEVVSRLQTHAEIARADLGDKLQNRKGSGVRPSGKVAQ